MDGRSASAARTVIGCTSVAIRLRIVSRRAAPTSALLRSGGMERLRALWRSSTVALSEREFRLLWIGQTGSFLGDALVGVALAFAVLELTGSAADLGLVFAAFALPRVLFTLAGGVWSDRLPRSV